MVLIIGIYVHDAILCIYIYIYRKNNVEWGVLIITIIPEYTNKKNMLHCIVGNKKIKRIQDKNPYAVFYLFIYLSIQEIKGRKH